MAQYTVEVRLVWDGTDWRTESTDMPNLKLANADAGDLARQVIHAFEIDHAGRDAELTLKMRLQPAGEEAK